MAEKKHSRLQAAKSSRKRNWLPTHLKPYVRSAEELRAETKHIKASFANEIIAQRRGN